MSAPFVVIPPDPLHVAAGVLRQTGDDLIVRARHLRNAGRSTRLNRADPGFSPALFRGRTSSVQDRLTEAATEAFLDVRCASRTVDQAIAADVVGAGDASGVDGAAVGVPGFDAGRGSPGIGPDIPLNPVWYLEELGRLATELDERLQFSAGACVGVCLNAAFQDGVLTTSVGAGLAYSVGADVAVKPIMSEEERTLDWEEHRIFAAVGWGGVEATKRVDGDGTTGSWMVVPTAGVSPLKMGGGWAYQWNRREELWDRDDDGIRDR